EVIAEIQRWSAHIPQLLSAIEQVLTLFNAEQLEIFRIIWNAIQQNQPLCIFINGKAGHGKTYLVNALCSQVHSHEKVVLATATSMFVAQLYPGGHTTHSTFKVPVNEWSKMLESPISPTDSHAELICKSSLIIWDEAPMANRAVLTCVNETCCQVMQSTLPFGGKVVILLGDFCQMCPVIHRGTRVEVINVSILRSTIWPKFTIHHLTTPICNADDPPFAAFVDAIGDGGGPQISFQGLQHAQSKTKLHQFTFP
ncbi:hypothetical protein BDM02DRAFT_3070378, partial [Thelephora ganbajun]